MVVAFYGLQAKVYRSPGMPNETRFVDMGNEDGIDETPRNEFKINVRPVTICNS